MARKFKKKGWDKVINNPVAKHSALAGKAGCHEFKKYTRKRKHKRVEHDQGNYSE